VAEVKPSPREGTDRGVGQPRTDEERLVAHWGEKVAQQLIELVGLECAVCTLPPQGTRISEDSDRRSGVPRTEAERATRHEERYGESAPTRGTGLSQKLGDVELAVQNLEYLTSKLVKYGLKADISTFKMNWGEKLEKASSDLRDFSALFELEKTAADEDWSDSMREGAVRAIRLMRES